MKKTFAKKRVTTISEAQANKSSNIKNPSIIRITTDKAIKTDKDGVKRIQTFLKKNPDASIDDILKLAVDYGDGTTSFKVINIEKSNVKYDDVVIVSDRVLRISKSQIIRGPPHLIKKAYEFIQKNPSIVSMPQKIIEKIDEPRYINVNIVDEEDDPDNVMKKLQKKDLSDETKSKKGEKISSKIKSDDVEIKKELVAQLYLEDEVVLDEEVEDETQRHLKTLTLLQKYNALGLMLKENINADILEKVESQRENIERTINVDVPTSITTNVFPDYSKRRPPLEKKFNPFKDTIEFTDTAGNLIVRKASEKLQKRMVLDTEKREKLGIRTQLIDVDENVTRAIRDYMRSELYDNIYKRKNVEAVSTEKPAIEGTTLFSRKAFFDNRLSKLPKIPDAEGQKLYNDFTIYKDTYTRTKNLNERSVILNHMTDIIVLTFKRMYPNVYGMYPYKEYAGFYERLNTINPGSFQINFKKYISKNLDKFSDREATFSKSFKKLEGGFEQGLYSTVDLKKYNSARIGDDRFIVEEKIVSNRKFYTGDQIDESIRKELAFYISNNLDADYKNFIVFPDAVNPTAADLHKVEKEYEEYKLKNTPQSAFVEIVEVQAAEKDVLMTNIIKLENNIYNAGASIYTYFYNSAKVLQFYSSNVNTVSKYSKSLLQRIELGDIIVSDLFNYEYKILLPEFFLNTDLNVEEFDKYIKYSQSICANDTLNVWIYTQIHKESKEEWYRVTKPKFNPEKYLVPIQKMCGTVDSTVFVNDGGNVKCISRKELKENITQYEKENTDELSSIVNTGTAPISVFKEAVEIDNKQETDVSASVREQGTRINYDTPQFKKLMVALVGMPGPKVFNVNIKKRVEAELQQDVDNDLLTQEEVDELDDVFPIGKAGAKITQKDINKFIKELDEYASNPIFGLAYLYVNEGIKRGKYNDGAGEYDYEIKWRGM